MKTKFEDFLKELNARATTAYGLAQVYSSSKSEVALEEFKASVYGIFNRVHAFYGQFLPSKTNSDTEEVDPSEPHDGDCMDSDCRSCTISDCPMTQDNCAGDIVPGLGIPE